MNKLLKLIAPAFGLFVAQSAMAYTITLNGTSVAGEGIKSSVVGAVTTDFNSGMPANYFGGSVVSGDLSNKYAAPPGDISKYFTVGSNLASNPFDFFGVVSLNSLSKYFGFYGGSPDAYNGLVLFRGNQQVGSFTGTQISTLAGVGTNGNQAQAYYFNIFADNPTQYFDKVVFTSTQAAFETDNHAVLAVPEPEEYAMMLAGLGVMGVVARRRRAK